MCSPSLRLAFNISHSLRVPSTLRESINLLVQCSQRNARHTEELPVTKCLQNISGNPYSRTQGVDRKM